MSHEQLLILDIALKLLFNALMFYTLSQFLTLKVKFWKLMLVIIAAFLLHYFIMVSFIIDYVYNTGNMIIFHVSALAIYFPNVIAVILSFKGTVWRKIGIYIFLDMLYALCAVISLVLFRMVLSEHPIIISPENMNFDLQPEHLYQWFIGYFLIIIVSGLAIWIGRTIKRRRLNWSFLLFPLLPIGQSTMLLGVAGTGFIHTWWAYIGLSLCFISNVVLLIVMLEQDKKTLLQDELRETRHAMELEQSHYREVEKRREELTKIRHDFNNQLAVISQLINTGEDSSAQDMINTLSKEIIETKENPFCNIPVINAILIEKTKTCEGLGIDLVVDLSLPTTLSVEQMHLCSIFGNLLDNAINACKQQKHTDKPTIQLSSMVDGDYLFIKAVNPSEEPPKTPMPGRGYGKRILSDLSARYGGDYRTEYNDGVFTAVVSLLAVSDA